MQPGIPRPNPKKTWYMGPYAVVDYIISPFVDAKVNSNTFIMGNPMPESTLTLCQIRLYLPVRDYPDELAIIVAEISVICF